MNAPPSRLSLSIIVPALDEAVTIEQTLAELAPWADELIVSDGGSRDHTVGVARRLGARVVAGEAGRGLQLNRGAAAATCDVLLFVHADTRLPPGSREAVQHAILSGAIGGGFSVRFDSERRIFRLGERIIRLRTSLSRAPLGDQAQFVLRSVFEEMGGFAPWPILEDLDFIRRLGKRGRIVVLGCQVTTAARRFIKRGITRTIATNWLIWLLYFCGVSPYRLARLYRHVR